MNDIQISYHSVKLMRDQAKENIANYCKVDTSVTPDQVWRDLSEIADKPNVALPDEFIRRMYNLSVALVNDKPLRYDIRTTSSGSELIKGECPNGHNPEIVEDHPQIQFLKDIGDWQQIPFLEDEDISHLLTEKSL